MSPRSLVSLLALAAGSVFSVSGTANPSAATTAKPATVRASIHDALVATDRTEPAIRVNPRDSHDIIAGVNPDYDEDNPSGVTDGYFYSLTGGNSWRGAEMPTHSPWTTEADPSLAVDARGRAYYLVLGESATSYCSTGSTAVLLSRSIDGGRVFKPLTVVDGGAVLHDKPSIAVESHRNKADHVFVVWTRPLSPGADMFFQRSVDGGAHFSRPRELVHSAWPIFGATVVTGHRGHVSVVWATFQARPNSQPMGERIAARASRDDGRGWGRKTSPSHGYFRGLPPELHPGKLRVLPSPGVAVMPSGRIAVTWAQLRHIWKDGSASADIEITIAKGSGRWVEPITVNRDHTRDRFMPTVSAIGQHGLEIAYYDRRRSYSDLDVYATRLRVSSGIVLRAKSVRLNTRVAPINLIPLVPSTSCYEPGRFFGDYISSAVDRWGYFHVIWADTQRHVKGVTDIWTASVRLRSPG